MHDCSPRKAHPFLAVPCGAQPPNLVESAFFGHVKRRLHRGRPAQGRQVRGGRRGHASCSTRSTRWALEQQAGLLRVIETRRVRAGRQQRDRALQGPHHRGQQLGPGRGGAAGQVPPGPVLPPQRDVVPPAAAARAGAGHRPAGARPWRPASTRSSARTSSTSARGRWTRWRPFPGRATSASWRTSCSRRCWSAAARSCCWSICRSRCASTGRAERPAAVPEPPRDTLVHNREALRAQRHPARPGQERLQPLARGRGARHQPRDAVQEDEEVRADARVGRSG